MPSMIGIFTMNVVAMYLYDKFRFADKWLMMIPYFIGGVIFLIILAGVS